MLWFPCTLLALFASAQGRAVNISNTWVLPEEGFPVFYRYFRDRISWYEADAVCQFHHANLVTVDTTAQYDAVRAYLKELDISSAVWVGLIRSNPDGDFTWTDYRGLGSEGYWSSAPDARAAPLCAAADPAADYRWEARACGGPTVASFICELPVPQWALGNDGCMVRALPALTVLYLPESAAVQLTADCGLAGVKRVQCTGNVKREELLKELSCNDEEDVSSTLSATNTSTMWSATDTPTTDQESITEEQSVEDTTVTDYKETSNTDPHFTETSTPYNLNVKSDVRKTKQPLRTQYITKSLNEELNLDQSDNILSNDIPHQDNTINHPNMDKLEENKIFKHRLLHDEMTRLGNPETIFTQPTDHFVPPLVMAKARMSDDMTVLSLKEKHAQQIAEQQLLKHNIFEEHLKIAPAETSIQDSQGNSNIVTRTKIDEHEQTISPPINQNGNSIKKDVKSSVPKKYIEKYNNLKGKIWSTIDSKIHKSEKIDGMPTLESSSKTHILETTTSKIQTNIQKQSEEDSIMDLTVIIKEPGEENSQKVFYSNHSDSVSKDYLMKNVTAIREKVIQISPTTEKPMFSTNPATEESISKVTLNHEVIKITLINDNASNTNSPPIVFEVSTMVPLLNKGSIELNVTPTSTIDGHSSSQISNVNSSAYSMVTEISSAGTQKGEFDPVTMPINEKQTASEPSEIDKVAEPIVASAKIFTKTIETNTNNENKMSDAVTTATIRASVGEHISDKSVIPEKNNETSTTRFNAPPNLTESTVTEKADMFNHTEHDEEQEQHESDMIDDYQSPLLSAANEPLHRPSRSRRPQPPLNRINKFNPFRILG